MNFKLVLGILAFVSLFALQLSFIKALPNGSYFYLSLVVLVFIVVLFGLEKALFWFLLNGFLLDLFAFKYFGFYTLLFVIILGVVYFLLSSVLTNRSLYAFLLLVATAVILYDVANYLVFSLSWHGFFSQELKRLLANFAITIIIFYSISLLSYRLRPVFLVRGKN